MGDEPADWKGHVIVCGLPGVGLRIVEQPALSGVPAVVADDDPAPALARMAAAWGVPLVAGPTRAEETLMSAGLAGAVAVICAQDDDLAALETGLAVRDQLGTRWERTPVVLRIFDPQLAHSVKETFGFRSVRSSLSTRRAAPPGSTRRTRRT